MHLIQILMVLLIGAYHTIIIIFTIIIIIIIFSISDIAKKFCYIAIAQLITTTTQVACWSIAGERQTQKLRVEYVKSLLRQEVGWYDMNNPSTLSTRVADTAGSIQDGITSRAAELFQFSGQFIGSYIVGLYLCWKLALVLLCALPFITGSAGFMVLAFTTAQNTVGETKSKTFIHSNLL